MPDKFIKIVEDKKYPKKYSQTGKALGKWEWAIDSKRQIYFRGRISGMSFTTEFQELGDSGFGQGLPLDTSDILFLAKLVNEIK